MSAAVSDVGHRAALAVVVQCHGVVCAIPARFISRLVLPDQVEAIPGSNLVRVHGSPVTSMAWDLGERLGMDRVDAAWVFMDVPYERRTLPMALRTGSCLVVDAVPPPIPLPAALFIQRPRAIAGAFTTKTKHCGLVVDVEHLWSPSELVATSVVLRGHVA